jgi:hypothetical protein
MPKKTAAVRIVVSGLLALAPAFGAPAQPNGGPGWVIGWGHGSVQSAVIPGTSSPCDPAHQCQLRVVGSGQAKTFFGAGQRIGPYRFVGFVTIDFTQPTSNALGGACNPAGGTFNFFPLAGGGRLVLDFQGLDCQNGAASSVVSEIVAAYIGNHSFSTGNFAGVTGTGSLNMMENARRGTVIVSYSGNLHF